MYVLTKLFLNWQDVTQGQLFSRSQLIWIQFSFFKISYLTKVRELCLPNYLPINSRD